MKRSRFHIGIHPFAVPGLFFLLCATPPVYAYAVICSVVLHEAGHLIASMLYGRVPQSIRLMPAGINIGLLPPRSYREELTVSAAGPVINLLTLLLADAFPLTLARQLASVSLLLAVLNLLPITGFDGGRICHALLSILFSETTADAFLKISTAISLAILWVLSLYVFFYSGVNVTLLLFCAYLFSYLIVKKL